MQKYIESSQKQYSIKQFHMWNPNLENEAHVKILPEHLSLQTCLKFQTMTRSKTEKSLASLVKNTSRTCGSYNISKKTC